MLPIDRVFEEHRPGLERLAYRMLGSLTDADDVMQDAYLKWTREVRTAVKSPRSYLTSLVTRLCIDQRRAIEARKEKYVGPWLPEPVVGPADPVEAAEAVSMAVLVVLESLSPVERAAYLLRRVFDFGYDEIGEVLGKNEPACRQLVSRAEERVRERRPRFDPDPVEAGRITNQFLATCATGDVGDLVSLLAEDAVLYSDGGGKALAALAPIYGADRVARFILGVRKKGADRLRFEPVTVNGRPGVIAWDGDQVHSVLTLDVADGRVTNVFIVRNPDKLARVKGEPAA
ncbi:MAG TPA: RNA polymerase sigma-70 factor [Gemmataceae bacterium]|jgi:RNA polymerase sigma-70 factor (ECF subfamily)|nr:RNA polymerase sigma-70 factor [Gemmataceae bacterium]